MLRMERFSHEPNLETVTLLFQQNALGESFFAFYGYAVTLDREADLEVETTGKHVGPSSVLSKKYDVKSRNAI